MPIVNTYNVFMSSANRTSGTSANFNIQLVRPITLANPNNWFSVRVGSAEIPYIFNLINSTNNVINFSITRGGTTYNGTTTITAGNYNIMTLLSEFAKDLAASIKVLTGWDPSSIFNFTYNRSTGLATFGMSPTDTTATSITIQNNSPIFMKCLGFPPSVPSFTFTYVVSATSTQSVNVLQNTAIYIRSDNLIQSVNFENIVANTMSDIIAKIQVNVNPMTMILWTNPSDLEVKINNRSIEYINLYVGDSTQYELNLGNLDWTSRVAIHEWEPDTDPLHPTGMATNMLPPNTANEHEVKQLMDQRKAIIDRLGELSGTLQRDSFERGYAKHELKKNLV